MRRASAELTAVNFSRAGWSVGDKSGDRIVTESVHLRGCAEVGAVDSVRTYPRRPCSLRTNAHRVKEAA